MTRRLSLTIACLSILTFAAAISAAEEVPAISGVLERIGALPAELIAAKKSDSEIVEGLFLATLLRLPTDKEKEIAAKHLADKTKNRVESGRDLAWMLINTKEFLKLHSMDKNTTESLRILNTLSDNWGKEKQKEQKR